MRGLFAIVFLAVMMQACNTVGCTDNRSSIPLAEFYSSTTDLKISVDSFAIGGVGAPDDSLLVKPVRGTSQVYLPLRSEFDNASFFIAYRWEGMTDVYNDTVRFDYEPIPYFASEECGAMYRYLIKKVTYTTHLLDSVVMLDTLITNLNIPSVRFYYPTANPDEEQ